MKINLKNIDNILNMNDENNFVAEVCNDFLLNNYYQINEESLKKETFLNLFMAIEGIDIDSTEYNILISHKANIVSSLKTDKYESNPYYKLIKIDEKQNKNIKLVWNYYQPYETFAYKDTSIDPSNYYKEQIYLGYFKRKFKYLELLENNQVWMSITPHEINTMEKSIDEAKGNVLVYGLGLGYYPFMCSLKDEVKHITIIEKDKKVIEVFNNYILPSFKNKSKITVVNDDAIRYSKKAEQFDYAFIDLWHEANDGLPLYIALKQNEKESCKYSYWIEESLLSLFRRCLITYLEEIFYDNYIEGNNDFYDQLLSKINRCCLNVCIDNEEQLIEFLSDKNIKKIIKEIK